VIGTALSVTEPTIAWRRRLVSAQNLPLAFFHSARGTAGSRRVVGSVMTCGIIALAQANPVRSSSTARSIVAKGVSVSLIPSFSHGSSEWKAVHGLPCRGTVAAGMAVAVPEGRLVPAALLAVTEHAYLLPLVSPVTDPTSHFTERRGDEIFADRAFQEKGEPRLVRGKLTVAAVAREVAWRQGRFGADEHARPGSRGIASPITRRSLKCSFPGARREHGSADSQ